MLYEVMWMFYALGICIFLGIGILGLAFSPSLPSPKIKAAAMVLCGVIILAGLYFSYRWYAEKQEIITLGQRMEQTMNQYLARYQKLQLLHLSRKGRQAKAGRDPTSEAQRAPLPDYFSWRSSRLIRSYT